jgi:hypothetical protein
MRYLAGIILAVVLLGCAGQTAHDSFSGVGKPVGTVAAATQAPIEGAAESYAYHSGKTESNPYQR